MKKKMAIKYSRAAATVSMYLALFLSGLVVFLFLLLMDVSKKIKENLPVNIVLNDDIKEKEIHYIKKILNNSFFSKSANYISKKKAIQQLARELEQNTMDFLEFNPLPSLITIHLKSQYANIDSLKIIKAYINKYSNYIKTIEFNEKDLQKITNSITNVNSIFLIIGIILSIISLMIITNTIRLKVYSEQLLIRTMQLVGTKKCVVYMTFIKSTILLGVISSLFACATLYCLVNHMANTFLYLKTIILDLNYLFIVSGYVFVLGIFINSIITYFVVNKCINTYEM
ncbi:MAG: permease-like cell division protein FtsX [Bacteroidales bacterium OttesenSCG-928-I14]|jgi:cell division transport system permease protein|nr:permease-like cell division protein FtsX [Bacteroidales bacterium OttesenSCG-928-I14]